MTTCDYDDNGRRVGSKESRSQGMVGLTADGGLDKNLHKSDDNNSTNNTDNT